MGWSAVAVGLVVLVVGWWLDFPAFTSLIPDQQAVRPNTAVGIALAGLTLIGVTRGRNVWVSGAAAWALLVIGAVTVGEFCWIRPGRIPTTHSPTCAGKPPRQNFRQLELIQKLGFDYVQGFLLGPPRAGDLHGDQPPVADHGDANVTGRSLR
ncbi:MAG: hypothetical protein KDB71_17950 [Mycobacterium sp.]|nr:hypothetical protein [Mycobacterium sp.]